MGAYRDAYDRSLRDPERFWGEAAEAIEWSRRPERVLDATDPRFPQWFPDGELNITISALDRHVRDGAGDRAAIIYDSPVTGSTATTTYTELLDQVARFAGGLRQLGVEVGDRVLIYLPMVPEALVAMLACARIGAIHSVVFGGFAPAELAVRIDDAKPKLIISASCGIEVSRVIDYMTYVDAALERAAHRPDHVVVLQRPQLAVELREGRDHDWAELAGADPVDAVPVPSTHPLYLLYTSGTTAKPKGVVRDTGGYAVALRWSMANVFDIGPGDVWWSASDVGWVVGHSYIVYAPLLTGATTIVYEGKPVGTPDASAFWRVIEDYRVKSLFTAPTAFRAIKREDPDGALARARDLTSFETLFLAGERLDPDTWQWATDLLGVPVIDNWWQTETGWPICANLRGLEPMPIKAGSPTVPVPGFDVRVLGPEGDDVPPGAEGAICIRAPLPPGTLQTLWQDDDRYVGSYFSTLPGHYSTGDGGFLDDDGYLFVMGRTDDVINVAGHRLSTGAMEAALAAHPDVAECAVIGVADELKGQVPRGFVVLKAGVDRDHAEVAAELVGRVRAEIGAVAALREIAVVPALPKTRSGKVLRRTMRGIADGHEEPVPSTIEDPAVLDALRPVLRRDQPGG